MELYRLGEVEWADSQLFYHALPRLGREGVVLCRPASPYLCLGYHQDLAWEVDREYCDRRGLPLFRREVGGGLVYLDRQQVFFQVVVHRHRPGLPARREEFYRRFLEPARSALAEFGIGARHRPPCDLWVGERKISGNGAGEIEDHYVFVGNLLLDFPVEEMVGPLRASAAFKERAAAAMAANLTTMRRELGFTPDPAAVEEALIAGFGELFADLSPAVPDAALLARKEALRERLLDPAWLAEPGRRPAHREVKIAEGLYLSERRVAAAGDEVVALLLLREGRVEELSFEPSPALPGDSGRRLADKLRGRQVEDPELENLWSTWRAEYPGALGWRQLHQLLRGCPPEKEAGAGADRAVGLSG
ncbi:MAG: lipoate--protein ligase family protein [Thermaerobacter sp.]|nr:lipoate--protein ligase family protein [Thermaerobacter sp.]